MSQRPTRPRQPERSASSSADAADAGTTKQPTPIAEVADAARRRPGGKAKLADAPRSVPAPASSGRRRVLDDSSDDSSADSPLKSDELFKHALQLRLNLLSGQHTALETFKAKVGVPRGAYEKLGVNTRGNSENPAAVVERAVALRKLLAHGQKRDSDAPAWARAHAALDAKEAARLDEIMEKKGRGRPAKQPAPAQKASSSADKHSECEVGCID